MSQKLDIDKIFQSEANTLTRSREDGISLHHTGDISACGSHIEENVRTFLKRMLPSKFEVNKGHLIDCNSITSPQLDVIISDKSNIPSLFTTSDNTTYIPIDSVYCVGEVKSSYEKSKKYISKFSATIKDIKENLHHIARPNTCFNGELSAETDLADIRFANYNKILNKLFFFMIFINGDNFTFSDISTLLRDTDPKYLPNIIILLNKGVIIKGEMSEKGFRFNKYPDESKTENEDWCFNAFNDTNKQISEGRHLAMLYYCIIDHLSKSYLEPPLFMNYVKNLFIASKSAMIKLKDTI